MLELFDQIDGKRSEPVGQEPLKPKRPTDAVYQCRYCGEHFVPSQTPGSYGDCCCKRHWSLFHSGHDQVCDVCGKTFRAIRSNHRICSDACRKVRYRDKQRRDKLALLADGDLARFDRLRREYPGAGAHVDAICKRHGAKAALLAVKAALLVADAQIGAAD